MTKRQIIKPSTILLKSMIIYLLEESQRPNNLKDMEKNELISFIEDQAILEELNFEKNKELKAKVIAFLIKMMLASLKEKTIETQVRNEQYL